MGGIDRRRVFDRVVNACATAAGCTRYELLRRERWTARPRQVAMLLLREITGCTWMQVAGHFDRDHATVIYGSRVARDEIARGHGKTFDIASIAVAILQQRRLPRPTAQEPATP